MTIVQDDRTGSTAAGYIHPYPKYGPTLQIIPDPDTNSLLIYLPPEERRFYP